MVELPETQDPPTEKIIGCAIEVHRVMGPGLLAAKTGLNVTAFNPVSL